MKCESKPLSLRLISLALSLCLLFGLMPVTVFAEDTNTTVAKIGDTTYSSLEQAITAADSGATITLLGDVSDVVIPEGKVVTIDLNGHTISSSSGHAITNNGTLTVTDNSEDAGGTVDGKDTSGKAALYNAPGAEATLSGGTFTCTTWYVIQNWGTMTINSGVTVNKVAGGTGSAIDNIGTSGNVATLTINGGSFASNINATVKNDNFGELTIEGGNFTATSGAVVQNANEATINGGSFTQSTSGKWVLYNTGTEDGNDGTAGKLTILGGDFTAVEGATLIGTFAAENGSSYGTVSISGGTFVGDLAEDVGNVTVIVSGGTFSENVPEEYLDEGLKAVKNDDGTYTIVDPNAPVEAVPEEKDDNTGLIVGALVVGAIAVTALTWKYLPVHQAMGSIQDKDWNGLPGATVTLLRDGKAVRTVVTNEGGGYEVYVPKGTYTLEVSYTVPETGEVVTASTEISVPTSNYSGDVVLNW